MMEEYMKTKKSENELIWWDATEHEGIEIGDINKKSVRCFLTKRTHYGKILKEDDYGVIIAHDIDGEEVDIIALPKGSYDEKETV